MRKDTCSVLVLKADLCWVDWSVLSEWGHMHRDATEEMHSVVLGLQTVNVKSEFLLSSVFSSPLPHSVCLHFLLSFIVVRHKGAYWQTRRFLLGQESNTWKQHRHQWILLKPEKIKFILSLLSPTYTFMNAFFWFHSPPLRFIPPSHPTSVCICGSFLLLSLFNDSIILT